jgi:cytochrome c556
MNRPLRSLLSIAITGSVLAGLATGCATHSSKPKLSSKEVMEKGFKGDTSLFKKISQGNGTQDDFKQLLNLSRELAKNSPTKGDAASWSDKTKALVTAAESLAQGKPGALDAVKAAANCKACHSVHKPS